MIKLSKQMFINSVRTLGIIMLLLLGVPAYAKSHTPAKSNSAKNTTATIAAEPTIYTQDQTSIIVTTAAPTFVIKLDSNPTTGYSWFLHEYDKSLIQPVKHEFVAPDTKLIGAGGYELWTFKVKQDGLTVPQQTTIRFAYARPWDGSDSASQIAFHVSTGVVK